MSPHSPSYSHTHLCSCPPCQTRASNPDRSEICVRKNFVQNLVRYYLILTDNFDSPARILNIRNDLKKLIHFHMLHLKKFI